MNHLYQFRSVPKHLPANLLNKKTAKKAIVKRATLDCPATILAIRELVTVIQNLTQVNPNDHITTSVNGLVNAINHLLTFLEKNRFSDKLSIICPYLNSILSQLRVFADDLGFLVEIPNEEPFKLFIIQIIFVEAFSTIAGLMIRLYTIIFEIHGFKEKYIKKIGGHPPVTPLSNRQNNKKGGNGGNLFPKNDSDSDSDSDDEVCSNQIQILNNQVTALNQLPVVGEGINFRDTLVSQIQILLRLIKKDCNPIIDDFLNILTTQIQLLLDLIATFPSEFPDDITFILFNSEEFFFEFIQGLQILTLAAA